MPLDPTPHAGFEAGARSVLTRVRGAYRDLLEALGGPRRAADVQAALALDKKLAWRIRKVTDAVDPIEGAAHVPSMTSARRVATAARKKGVTEQLAAAILEATDGFERFVADEAEDRTSFEAMAASIAGRGLEGILLEARRSAYRASVLLHGKLSEALVYALVVGPGRDAKHLTAVSLRGHVGLQRLRPNASVELARHRFDSDGRPLDGTLPLDPEAAAAFHAPLLPAFSSADVGDLEHVEVASGFRRTFLAGPELGPRGARTYMLGERTDDLPLDEEALGSLCEVATPTKRLVHDLLLHEDVGVAAPEVRVVLSRRETEAWPALDDPGVLPIECRVADLGRGLEGAGLPEGEAHRELLRFGAEAVGLDPQRLRHYRVLVDYPVQHSVVWLRSATR